MLDTGHFKAKGDITAGRRFVSNLPDGGLSPFSVLSKVLNLNLNAEFVGGYRASQLAVKANNEHITGFWDYTYAPTIAVPGTAFDSVATYGQITGRPITWTEILGKPALYDVADIDYLLVFKADKTTEILSGVGMTGGGPISVSQTLSFDTVWGDARYALASGMSGYVPTFRALNVAGTSGRIVSTGGAQNLSADRSWILDLATSGVSAGSYTAVTVDVYGRVIAGTNPSTLAGHGITDALTEVQSDARYVPNTRAINVAGTSGRIVSTGGAQTLAADRSWNIDLATTGISASTYRSVTVDIYGRITAGTNPSTRADYGITDMYDVPDTDYLLLFKADKTTEILPGTGMTGGGSFAISRTLGFDIVWGDARYALSGSLSGYVPTSRAINVAGTSGRIVSTGGAQNLSADRSWNLDLDVSGVTPGTYRSVSVDAYGRVTAGTNPTTRADYGITDIYDITDTDYLLSFKYPNTNPAGYISGINSTMIGTALGYTPMRDDRTATINGSLKYLNTNPSWTVSDLISGYMTSAYIPKWNGSNLVDSRISDAGAGRVDIAAGLSVKDILASGDIDCGLYEFFGAKISTNVGQFANSVSIGGAPTTSTANFEVRSTTHGSIFNKMNKTQRLAKAATAAHGEIVCQEGGADHGYYEFLGGVGWSKL